MSDLSTKVALASGRVLGALARDIIGGPGLDEVHLRVHPAFFAEILTDGDCQPFVGREAHRTTLFGMDVTQDASVARGVLMARLTREWTELVDGA